LINELGVNAEAGFIARETPFCEPFEIPEGHEAVKTVVGAATRVLGRAPGIEFHEGPCDSCILVSHGRIPTIEFGPSGGRLHQSDEFVDLESVKTATEVYKEVIRTMLS
jgi:acetylornithine deacetylase/succinyl-diaminopimelate desuccinylase-like protein